jgi:hypothetical protein
MNLRALQQFTDEIFGQNRHTDSMNDYYPHTLYLDTEQGTYGDASRIQLISTTDWTQEDCDTWETMTDSERCQYADDNGQHNQPQDISTPFMWRELSNQ